MAKLSRRIRDVLRASLLAPPRLRGLGQARPPTSMEAQLEHIRTSLAQAAAREKRLQDDMALAEQEGRERDALRLQRQLADLARSSDELRAVLELIEARIEVERQAETQPTPEAVASLPEEAASPQVPLAAEADQSDDLAARKERLSAPEAGGAPPKESP